MTYGSRADVPMGEFWSDTFTTWFSCREAASIAHSGQASRPRRGVHVGRGERWQADPASLKTLGDRAFCEGINRFVIHRYAQQPWNDRWPGMTMGIYGIHSSGPRPGGTRHGRGWSIWPAASSCSSRV